MTMQEAFPVVPYERFAVSSDEVVDSLIYRDRVYHYRALPPRLDMSFFSRYFAELYQSTSEDPSLVSSGSSGSIERSTVIYHDFDTRTIDMSPIRYGELTTVTAGYEYLFEKNALPVISVHTHPWNAFFSIQDFHAVLVRGYENGLKISPSAVVLCPDHQVLAIATAQTPTLEVPEFEELRRRPIMSPAEEKRYVDLAERCNRIQKAATIDPDRIELQLKMFADQLKIDGVEDRELHNEMIQAWSDDCRDYTQDILQPKLLRVNEKVIRAYQSFKEKILNRSSMQVARDMNLKLYMSMDGAHFTEFSA